jgi:hypothetical protein
MPTKYRADLDHIGFDWSKDPEIIRQKLLVRSDLISATLKLTAGGKCSSTPSLQTEGTLVIDEIVGILAWAAAVQMDAGFKAANKVRATIGAVEKDPSVIAIRKVEPEALGMVASKYQRADELPGTHWYDIYQDENAAEIDLQQVSRAAVQADLQLRAGMKKGRPRESVLEILAGLREIFERYNADARRHSVLTSINGKLKQEEAGPFLEFLKIAIAPLNEFLADLQASHGAKPISPAQIMRKRANFNRRSTL